MVRKSFLFLMVSFGTVLLSETANGYVLPPEPDPAINNATLLGVDSNGNGVRDDVERWIITKYKDHHQIVTAIGLQGAKAAQIIIQQPENARQTMKFFDAATDCAGYFEFEADINNEPILLDHYIFGKEFKAIQFNTSKRSRAFGRYNAALSGGVYDESDSSLKMRSKCDFDVDALLGKR